MRLVLDTNVVVSALFWKGNERRVLTACLDGRHRTVTSTPLIAEAERVLSQKFAYPKEETAAYLGSLLHEADLVAPRTHLAVVTEDPTDDRVLECALDGQADLIVTGDRHLLRLGRFRSIRIVRASDALRG